MISINSNLYDVKKGMLLAIKLFKEQVINDSNIILYQDNDIYINNISRMLELNLNLDKGAEFGFKFVLDNLKNLRYNIAINPILYLLSLEILIKSITNTSELGVFKGKFSNISTFLLKYYNSSNLKKVALTKKNIQSLFNITDTFLDDVVTKCMEGYNIEIQQDKYNKIAIDSYYRLPCYRFSGPVMGNNYKIFITYFLDETTYTYLLNQKDPILILCHEVKFNLSKDSSLPIYKISHGNLLTKIQDIINITHCSVSIDFTPTMLQNYIFGSCKEYKFFEGRLYLLFDKYLSTQELNSLNKQDTYDRYYMSQGRNLTIICEEEYFERVHILISFIKSVQYNGIFYSEVKTLKLLMYNYSDDKDLSSFLYKLLEEYLKIFKISTNKISEVINSEDLTQSFNPNIGTYDKDSFTSLDMYLNIFTLLDSNVEVLNRVY